MKMLRRTTGSRGAVGVPSWGWLVLVSVLTFVPFRAGAQEAPAAEPEFKPGIPGLKMVDVRDHKQLWRDIEELQTRESGDRISIAEYRRQAIEKTSRYLGLDGAAADRFAAAADDLVAELRASFLRSRRADAVFVDGVDPFDADLDAVVAELRTLLGKEPRQQLFEPEGKKWLLRLAFSSTEAKEAKEAKEAQEAQGALNDQKAPGQ